MGEAAGLVRGRLACVRTYRDRSLEKYEHFPVKLPNSGPDKSERIVAEGGEVSLMRPNVFDSDYNPFVWISWPEGRWRHRPPG